MKQDTPLQKLLSELDEYRKISRDDIESNKKIKSSLLVARAEGQMTAFKIAMSLVEASLPYEREVIEKAADTQIEKTETTAKQYFEQTFKTE